MIHLYRLHEERPMLAGTECAACHYRWFPPATFGCERCGAHGDSLRRTEFEPGGRLLSLADIRLGDEEITVGILQLDAGPVIRVLLEGIEPLSIGDRVEGELVSTDAATRVVFRKAI